MSFESIAAFIAGIPTDWMILGSFAIFAALDCLRSGARRIAQLALALPLAVFVSTSLPEAAALGSITSQFSTSLLQALLFLAVFIGVYVLVGRIGLSWGSESGQTIQAALAGVAGAAIVAVFWIQLPVLDALWHFGPSVQDIFGPAYRFWWLLSSYATLGFVRGS